MTNRTTCRECQGDGFHVYPPGRDRFNQPLPYDTVLPCLHCDATGAVRPPAAAETAHAPTVPKAA